MGRKSRRADCMGGKAEAGRQAAGAPSRKPEAGVTLSVFRFASSVFRPSGFRPP
jgi:hypothetical protein